MAKKPPLKSVSGAPASDAPEARSSFESPFLLTIGNPETREHLREEIALRFPLARFAFSEGRLTSFKHGPAGSALWTTARFPEIHCAESVGLFVSKTADVAAPDLAVPEGYALRALSVAGARWWALFPNGSPVSDLIPFEYPLERSAPTWGTFKAGEPKPVVRLPSRAYYKLAEMVAAVGGAMRPGEHVVEVGCAPGGMSLYALEAGAIVLGIDRAVVAQDVRSNRAFTQLHSSIGEAREAETIPATFDHLVVDMHASPRVMLQECDFLLPRVRSGVFLTLKLNEPKTVGELPTVVDRLRRSRPWRRVFVGQLPSHHQEICFVGTL